MPFESRRGIHNSQALAVNMANSTSYFSQFKQHAFIWKPVFAQRQTRMYESEDGKRVDLPEDPNLGTEEVIDNFLYRGCQHDIRRYLYLGILAEFLGMADMELLRRDATPRASVPMVLMDDRNGRTPCRRSTDGNLRTSPTFTRPAHRPPIL